MNIVAERPLRKSLSCTLPTCACRINNFIWVSEKLNLVYFETPKCGCSSIKHALDIRINKSQFAMAFLIQSGRFTNGTGNLLSLRRDLGSVEMSFHQFDRETLQAALQLVRQPVLSLPSGRFGFQHFFGEPENAVRSFPDYRKVVVVREPFERLHSAWNMFYNSSRARLRQRVCQTEKGIEEMNDIECMIEDLTTAPNHHFEPLTRFVPIELLESGQVEAVPLPHLRTFWSDLGLPGRANTLPHLNKGMGKPASQSPLDELRRHPSLIKYYEKDAVFYQELARTFS